ncbi:hypothetical protein BDQ12DRAFT_502547 [Crucibulum laeve]|uniref:F-box domain-containing protein n=1 Tax=Crucibulum laeve TaxID=68775 RepID=A0A5C3LH14_9AGAR|nr:hypothetical protein BDQ12DRAFT_502547 [Crucibulum laeve]
MHSCLMTEDILVTILQWVHDDSNDGKRTLAILARTCKTFKEIALDILWREIPNLAPLVRTLPVDTWEIKFAGGPPIAILRRKTTAADWTRCCAYTPRIKRLGYEVPKTCGFGFRELVRSMIIGPDIFEAIKSTSLLQFPNLRHLYWDQAQLPQLPVTPFLGPSIRTLQLNVDSYGSSSVLCKNLPQLCPSLRRLNLNVTAESQVVDSHSPCCTLIQGICESLEALFCNNISLPVDVLQELATSTKLKRLHVGNDMNDILRHFPFSELPFFPALSHLYSTSKYLASVTRFIERVGSRSFESVEITTMIPPPESDLQYFFKTLKRHCNHDDFKSLSVHHLSRSFYSIPAASSGYDFISATVKPLLVFRNLEKLSLKSTYRFMLDNTDLGFMAVAWRNIQELVIGDFHSNWGSELHITLDGLLPLTRYCPDLEILGISLQGVTTSANLDEARKKITGSTCRKVKTLTLGSSTIEDPISVAEYLAAIFPNLTWIMAVGENKSSWEEVSNFLKYMRL